MNEKNYDKVFIYLTESANKNYELAVKLLMHLYAKRINEKQDHSKTVSYYENIINMTDSFSINYLGWMYLNGVHYEKDIEKALMYFKRGKKLNNLVSIHNIGSCYKDKGQYQKAIKYFEKAINLGYVYSYCIMGYLYHYGGRDIVLSYKKAMEYYSKCKCGYCCHQLGTMHKCGTGVPINNEKAIEYYEKSVNLGYTLALSSLANYLYYTKDSLSSQEFERVFKLHSKGVELKNWESANFIDSNKYYNTDPENYKKALKLCRCGSQNIIHLLNKILIDGKGRKKDRIFAESQLVMIDLSKFVYVPEKLKKYKDIRIQYEKDINALKEDLML